ncbi:MAG: DUF2207 domain-containing protein [Bdellovibrionales bacterium]|nr:DUF2207 domain-containing protein [Bdellovibrionales bacterium]
MLKRYWSRIIRKKLFFVVICFLVALPHFVFAQSERITSYDVDIEIHKNSDITVIENIVVVSRGEKIRRGIFREFPTRYRDRHGNDVVVGFRVLEVLRDGQPEPYHMKSRSNGEVVYIGKSDVLLSPGIHTYTLKFSTNQQVGFFEGYDELYFNAIGHGWDFPIEKGSVSVTLPPGVAPESLQAEGYTGAMGSRAGDFQVVEKRESYVRYLLTRPLLPQQGFTIALTWPKGFVREPSRFERLLFFLESNVGSAVGIFGLFFLGAYYLKTWSAVGKDPPRGTIIPRFEAPEGYSPAEVRYVLDMGFSDRCFTALLYALAIKNIIKIRSESSSKFMLERGDEFSSDIEGVSSVEKDVARLLLPHGVVTQNVDSKQYQVFLSAKLSLEKWLKNKHLKQTFQNNYQYLTSPFLGSVGVVAAMYVMPFLVQAPEFRFTPINIAILVLLGIGYIVFALYIPAPTRMGRRVMDKIEGYKMYLETAERDRYKGLAPDQITAELYERHLPFAVALGVEQQWTKRFEADLAQRGESPDSYHPRWHSGSRSWNESSMFSRSLSDSFSSAIASSSTPPGSSSGSSSGGGGGSSGGGGGGGGGGGW